MTINDTFGKWPGTETEVAATLEKDSPAYIQGWNDCHAHMTKEIIRLDGRIGELEACLQEVADIAHTQSTGPAEPDWLWTVRELAYELL